MNEQRFLILIHDYYKHGDEIIKQKNDFAVFNIIGKLSKIGEKINKIPTTKKYS